MEEIVGISRAIGVGPYIAVGGTAPVDRTGQTVGIGDVYAQTTQRFEIVMAALEQAGSDVRDIVRTRVILTDIDTWRAAIEARKHFCRDCRPVDTIMAVTRFVNPDWLVEIEVDSDVADEGSCGSTDIGAAARDRGGAALPGDDTANFGARQKQ